MKIFFRQISFFISVPCIFLGMFFLCFYFLNLSFSLADSSVSNNLEQNFIQLKADNFSENLAYSNLVEWMNFSPYLVLNKSYNSEIENIDYCFTEESICELTYSVLEKYHFQKKVKSSIDETKVNFYLTLLAEKINKEPENAKIKFNVDTQKLEVVLPEKNGLALNIEKSTKEIIDKISGNGNFPKEIELIYDLKKAEISSDNLESLGIKEMISEGYSTFKGSTPTRIHNIKTAIQQFDGWIIKPNEEVSFVQRLGEVDGEHGYKQELVIKQNKTEKEFGGGVCQVSTTTFRAAIYSGLQITARKNHAYPVSYYSPQGMDAAIYIPKPDLKFINNTANYILVQVELREETNELFFRFYGTNDGRKVEVTGPFVTQRNPDGSLRTYFTQKVTDKNGAVVLDETFRSFYASPSKYPH